MNAQVLRYAQDEHRWQAEHPEPGDVWGPWRVRLLENVDHHYEDRKIKRLTVWLERSVGTGDWPDAKAKRSLDWSEFLMLTALLSRLGEPIYRANHTEDDPLRKSMFERWERERSHLPAWRVEQEALRRSRDSEQKERMKRWADVMRSSTFMQRLRQLEAAAGAGRRIVPPGKWECAVLAKQEGEE